MVARCVRHAAYVVALILVATSATHAAIFRWDTGEVIPGTLGIWPRPGVQLVSQRHWDPLVGYVGDGPWNTDDQNLRYADFSGLDLSRSRFSRSWLDNADLSQANLAGAIFAHLVR